MGHVYEFFNERPIDCVPFNTYNNHEFEDYWID